MYAQSDSIYVRIHVAKLINLFLLCDSQIINIVSTYINFN